MSDATKNVPEQNIPLNPSEPHMEFIDLPTRQVWQSRGSLTAEDYGAMVLEAPLVKVGLGRAAMDAHWFRRSPGAPEDGAVELRELYGREFLFCAMPEGAGLGESVEPGGPRRLMVNKHHSLLYRAGRSLDFLRLPEGLELVHVIAADEGAPPLKLPEGWTRESVVLESDFVVHLPCPATVFFFPNGDSFQGPVERPRAED